MESSRGEDVEAACVFLAQQQYQPSVAALALGTKDSTLQADEGPQRGSLKLSEAWQGNVSLAPKWKNNKIEIIA